MHAVCMTCKCACVPVCVQVCMCAFLWCMHCIPEMQTWDACHQNKNPLHDHTCFARIWHTTPVCKSKPSACNMLSFVPSHLKHLDGTPHHKHTWSAEPKDTCPWGFGHTHIICGVQARLGKCLADSHVCLLHHGVASPWVEIHCVLTKVVQVVELGWSAPYVQTFAVWIICHHWPHEANGLYAL